MNFAAAFRFLHALSKNNNREWFEKRKPTYLAIKSDFEEFVAGLLTEMIKFDESLAGLNPKKLTFRIYRDVRFSKDKRPYKNNLSAGFSSRGKMVEEPGYYLHIQNGRSFIAGGMWMPNPENLAKIRQEIDYNGDKFLKILNDRKFKKLFRSLDPDDRLKTAPKGYAADHPLIDLLKNKSFIVSHTFSDKEVMDKKFLKQVAGAARTLKPLNDFLGQAIG